MTATVSKMDDTKDETEKPHFLVVAAFSRGARFLVEAALQQGYAVTAICRALDEAGGLARRAAGSKMEGLLAGTILTEGGLVPALTPGKLRAVNRDILQAAAD